MIGELGVQDSEFLLPILPRTRAALLGFQVDFT
jgi:hypothetical protein